jgi:hypothetical protein
VVVVVEVVVGSGGKAEADGTGRVAGGWEGAAIEDAVLLLSAFTAAGSAVAEVEVEAEADAAAPIG